MHIETLYCSTYSSNEAITGHMDIKTDAGMVRVIFCPEECARIQEIGVEAYQRQSARIIDELASKTPALVALPAPKLVEDAEFEEMPF